MNKRERQKLEEKRKKVAFEFVKSKTSDFRNETFVCLFVYFFSSEFREEGPLISASP